MLQKTLLSLVLSGLLALQFLLWRQLSFDQLRFSALGCIVLLVLLWGKRRRLTFQSGPGATLAGLLLIAFFVVRSSQSPGGVFASLAPVLWGTGLALLASGFGGLKQYRRELLVLLLLVSPFFLRWLVFDALGFDLSPVTARAGVGLVRVLGWPARLDGDMVTVPTGVLNVYQACSGLKSMFFLFGLGLLFAVIFPPASRLRALMAPLAGIAADIVLARRMLS